MNTPLDVQALNTFAKVVQAGSFTRAAEALGTQKAHVSRVVSQLERELGVRLLERTTRALSLTEVGRELYERASTILAALDDTRQAMHRAQGEPRGTLRLSSGVEFGQLAVSGWVARYLQRHPQVRVEADYSSRVVDLVHEGFDLAIRVGPLADSTLAARRLGELSYSLYAAPAYLKRAGTPESPDALDGHDSLVFTGGRMRASWTLHHEGSVRRLALNPRLRANHVHALRDAAQAGLGIAQLPDVFVREALAAGRLRRVLPAWRPPAMPVHAVFPSARYLAPKVRAFIDLAVAGMREMSGTSKVDKVTTTS